MVQSSFGRDTLGSDSVSLVQQPNELNSSVDNTTSVEVTTHHLTHLGLSLDAGLHMYKEMRFSYKL